MNRAYIIGIFLLLALFIAVVLVIIFGEEESPSQSKPSSPSPLPSPSSTYRSLQIIQASDMSTTFNYVSDPQPDGSSGYLTYNRNSDMLKWPVKLPKNFTHAKIGGMFKFRKPGTSDTYGYFEDGSSPPNFFMRSIDLGTFSPLQN